MAYEINELSGSLFENKKKKTVKHPDKTGKCKIDGKLYWVSAWDTVAENMTEYQQLKFSPVEEKPQEEPKPLTEAPF